MTDPCDIEHDIEQLDEAYAAALDSQCHDNDFEADHSKADKLLCELLTKLGYSNVVEAFNRVQKWY